jgi:hypothetical protein
VQQLLRWESNKYQKIWGYVGGLSYAASNGQAPNCHPWTARLYNIFSIYFINGTIFGKSY